MAENSKTVGNIVVWHEPHCKKHAFRWKTKLLKFDCYFSFLGQKNNIKVYQNMHKENIIHFQICLFVLNYEKKGTFENVKKPKHISCN